MGRDFGRGSMGLDSSQDINPVAADHRDVSLTLTSSCPAHVPVPDPTALFGFVNVPVMWLVA